MSSISSLGYKRLPSTYMEVGRISIPVAVPEAPHKSKRRRSRRRSSHRRRNVSMSSNYDNTSGDNGNAYQHQRNSSIDKGFRSRKESFGNYSTTSRAYSTSSRTSNDHYSTRRSNGFGRINSMNAIGHHSDDHYDENYDGHQDRNLRWDRDRMSRQIWRFYQNNCQSQDLWERKSHLKEALQKILTNNFPDYNIELHIVGSTANGLAGKHADLDICLIMNKKAEKVTVGPLVVIDTDPKQESPQKSPKKEVEEIVKLENESPENSEDSTDKLNTSVDSAVTATSTNGKNDESIPMLEKIMDVLKGSSFVQKMQIIFAKVPILKFIDRISQIEVTINVNKLVSIRNTQLIRDYTRVDWRLQPLVMVIKAWAKDHNIKDAYNKSISSYSLVLMVIHYLQYGCDPPVLPCLQRMDPHRYSPTANIHDVVRKKRWNRWWMSRNNSSLKELLIGFLDYYSYTFLYDNDAISVRLGHPIPKSKAHAQGFPFLSIEEPFNRSNTAHSVYDRVTFERILSVFRVSHYTLRRYPFLNSIMAGQKFANENVGQPDQTQDHTHGWSRSSYQDYNWDK